MLALALALRLSLALQPYEFMMRWVVFLKSLIFACKLPVLLAAVGVAVGTGLGIGYGWAAAACLGAHAVEHVPLVVPWGRITVLAVTAVAAGALASVLPARRATRVSPTAALGVE